MSEVFPYLAEHEAIGPTLRTRDEAAGLDYTIAQLRNKQSGALIEGAQLIFIRDTARWPLPEGSFMLEVVQGKIAIGRDAHDTAYLQKAGRNLLVLREDR